MKKITLISGHPDLAISVGNKIILDELKAHFDDNINIRKLDSLYPDYRFDVAAEQAADSRVPCMSCAYTIAENRKSAVTRNIVTYPISSIINIL